MKVGIDLHGTIDSNPEFFSKFIKVLKKEHNAEIHVTTGVTADVAIEKLEEMGIEYDCIFSITDYHKSIGTEITYDENGEPWIDEELWNRTKGDYCLRELIVFHIDDTEAYGKHFVPPTVSILFNSVSKHFISLMLEKYYEHSM